ncbi:Zinc/iron permease [Gaertneriomyces semiglobifer]|nr:Zinc/iron permease [Gaertneriomyces semiglobifer]
MSDSVGNVGLAFGICIGAGLATAVGSCLPFVVNKANPVYLSVSLAVSAGVMIYVSFMEIFTKSLDAFSEALADRPRLAYPMATVCLFGGMGLCAILDLIVHRLNPKHNCSTLPSQMLSSDINGAAPSPPTSIRESQSNDCLAGETGTTSSTPQPLKSSDSAIFEIVPSAGPRDHEIRNRKCPANLCLSSSSCYHIHHTKADKYPSLTLDPHGQSSHALHKMGLLSAIAIAVHNLPEGLATFMASLSSPSLGASLAVAIAIHNIPEGIVVALPIYYSTGSKWKAFMWGTLSGVSEPMGAAVGYGILKATGNGQNGGFSPLAYGIMFGLVGGIMIFISLTELLPTAHRYCQDDQKIKMGMVGGMAIMALSLVLFKL